MGMDIHGKAPSSNQGEYFRNNVWWWRPLADYCCAIAPDVTAACRYWQSNDGDGLNAEASLELARLLRAEKTAGRTAAYATTRDMEHAMLPDKVCSLCTGSGVRNDAVGVDMSQPTRRIEAPEFQPGHPRFGSVGWCNGCNGTGRLRPDETYYPFSVENVEEFVMFLEACGGFEIR